MSDFAGMEELLQDFLQEAGVVLKMFQSLEADGQVNAVVL